MERKTLFTFIAVYSFALAVTLFFSSDDEINATTVVDQPSSYILQGNSTDAVVAAVQSVGGTVTHELGIINSVAATLTSLQYEALLVSPAILAISENASIRTATALATVRDDFTAKVYSSNDGTVDWLGDWAEINDGGGAVSGNVFVATQERVSPP